MPSDALIVRTFRWADLEARVELMRLIGGDFSEPLDRAVERERRLISMPGASPERDIFIAELSGECVGHLGIIVERQTGRAIGAGGVHIDYRGRGFGRTLLRQGLAHASALGLTVFQFDLQDGNAAAISLCKSEGFSHVRTHLHMRIDSPKRKEVPVPKEYAVRPVVLSDVPALTELQNAAFTGSWGYQPNVHEEVAYRIYKQPLAEPDLVVVLATSDGSLVAYCWCEHGAVGDAGTVGMVGVAPALQGRGLGRVITGAGLNQLVDAGARPIGITVDEANEPALRLYRSLGFEVRARSVWYEKVL